MAIVYTVSEYPWLYGRGEVHPLYPHIVDAAEKKTQPAYSSAPVDTGSCIHCMLTRDPDPDEFHFKPSLEFRVTIFEYRVTKFESRVTGGQSTYIFDKSGLTLFSQIAARGVRTQFSPIR